MTGAEITRAVDSVYNGAVYLAGKVDDESGLPEIPWYLSLSILSLASVPGMTIQVARWRLRRAWGDCLSLLEKARGAAAELGDADADEVLLGQFGLGMGAYQELAGQTTAYLAQAEEYRSGSQAVVDRGDSMVKSAAQAIGNAADTAASSVNAVGWVAKYLPWILLATAVLLVWWLVRSGTASKMTAKAVDKVLP
jgi:hypothetical protein